MPSHQDVITIPSNLGVRLTESVRFADWENGMIPLGVSLKWGS